MSHHTHLTLEEREEIMEGRAEGKTMAAIARSIGRSKSTVSRELSRNSGKSKHPACRAQEKCERRREACRPRRRLSDPALLAYVSDKLFAHRWSPEEIAGRYALEKGARAISFATIYRAVESGELDGERTPYNVRSAVRKLRHRGKKRHKKGEEERRGKIPISHPISERPKGAEDRSERGHFEGDTVAGKQRGACLVTLVDRKTRYLVGGKAKAKRAAEVNEVMVAALKGEGPKSVTPDRGKEFALHAEVTEALDEVQFYFPAPRHPWERGTNENTNGLIREYFPKGESLDGVADEEVRKAFDEINKRPRKCLGYRTPYEEYHSTELQLV